MSGFTLIGMLALLVVAFMVVPAWASSIYGLQVRTSSTEQAEIHATFHTGWTITEPTIK